MQTTKTQQAVEKYKTGDLKGALKLASSFRIGVTREEHKVLKRGYECLSYPTLYEQMGIAPQEATRAAARVFERFWARGAQC